MNSEQHQEIIKVKPELTIVDYTEKFQNPINLECTTTEEVCERLNAAMSKIQKDIDETKAVKKHPNPDIPEDELVTVDIQEITDYVTGREDLKKTMQQINNLTNE